MPESFDRQHSTDAIKRSRALAALVLAVVLLLIELWKAPIVLLISAIAMSAAIWRSRAGLSRPRRHDDPLISREAQIGALLLSGLWVGVFLVFWLADSNVDSSLSASVPVRFDGETVSSTILLLHGLISTVAATLLTIGLNSPRARRRRRPHGRSANGK
jgi:hypothetical protein